LLEARLRRVARRKKQSTDAPTSIRLSADLKEALRDEGRREQKQQGGPPRSLHYVIVTVLKEWVDRKRKERAGAPPAGVPVEPDVSGVQPNVSDEAGGEGRPAAERL
jgi:hypothetical protein